MQLDQITANIRLRNPWEAIDLGFALIRNFWRTIYLPWFIFLSCISILIFIIVPADYKEYAIIAVWWLKPLYDRFLLNILSHRLFNENLSTAQALQAIPKLAKTTGLIGGLTFRRPSFSRGFNLPIWQLEQLRGKPRSERQQTLLKSAHSHAIGLTLGMIFIELTIYFSIYALILLFIPTAYQETSIINLFTRELSEEVALWMHILDHAIYTVALFLIEPFYIAASFTLYLNRRTQLEAWDIELVFKQLAKRLQSLGGKALSIFLLPILVFLLATTASNPVYADKLADGETDPQTEYLSEKRLPVDKSDAVITEIMQRTELSNEKASKRWVKKEKKKKEKEDKFNFWNLGDILEPFVKIIAVLFESSLWVALAFGLILLYITRNSWLYLFKNYKQDANDYEPPDVMFGMDIRPQSLPENIPEAARKLWLAHQHREALSLLYRGALAQLIAIDKLPLKASQTEGDILNLAKQTLLPDRQAYLKQLTKQWKKIAYAHKLPQEQEVNQLFDNWNTDFTNIATATESAGQVNE